MPRPSKIDRLPDELKKLIADLRKSGRTLDEILAHLRQMAPDTEISRSGLHRHIQQEIDQVIADVRHTEAIAKAVVSEFGQESDSDIARANIQLAHGMLMKVIRPEGHLVTLDPEEAMFIARAIQALTSSSKATTENVLKIRKEAATKAEKIARKEGLSAETIQKIREGILGV